MASGTHVAIAGFKGAFDCTIDPGGGADYTTLEAAVSAGHVRIFANAGTYTETVDITDLPNYFYLEGESADYSCNNSEAWPRARFNFGGTPSGALSGGTGQIYQVTLKNVAIEHDDGDGDYVMICESGGYYNNLTIINCRFDYGGINLNDNDSSSNDIWVENCHFYRFHQSAITTSGSTKDHSEWTILNNNFFSWDVDGQDAVLGIVQHSNGSIGRLRIEGNQFNCDVLGTGDASYCIQIGTADSNRHWYIANNHFDNRYSGTVTNYKQYAIYMRGDWASMSEGDMDLVIEGNHFYGNYAIWAEQFSALDIRNNIFGANGQINLVGTTGSGNFPSAVMIRGNRWLALTNNTERGDATAGEESIIIDVDSQHVAVMDNYWQPTSLGRIDNQSATSIIMGNAGLSLSEQVEVMHLENNSGATLNLGEIVVPTLSATEYEIDTTTTAQTVRACGVVQIATGTGKPCPVVVKGRVDNLKVDGTTDIAINDPITTSTTAGVGQKAVTGDWVIATAMEAYTTDDALGTIKAYVEDPYIM